MYGYMLHVTLICVINSYLCWFWSIFCDHLIRMKQTITKKQTRFQIRSWARSPGDMFATTLSSNCISSRGLFLTYREEKTGLSFTSLFIQVWQYAFSICITKHSALAWLSHSGVAGADMTWFVPVPCSQSADSTSPTLTSQMFIGSFFHCLLP